MAHSPWGGCREILLLLHIPKIHYHAYSNPSLARLIHSTPLHFISLRTVLIMPNPLRLDLLRGFINSGFQNNFCIRFSSILCVLNTYLFTPWSRVILEKLTGSQLVKNFPAFYGTRRFITAFTWPYPEPDRLSPYPHIPLPEDPL